MNVPEFLDELGRSELLQVAEHRQQLAQFLSQCDLVKFAKVRPGEDVHEATLSRAEQVVQATRDDGAQAGAA